MSRAAAVVIALMLPLIAGCGSSTPAASRTPNLPPATAAAPSTPSTPVTPSEPASATASATPRVVHHETHPDPRWRFFSTDQHWYTSGWFTGVHRIMIGFGCNASPWYDHDPRCPGTDGFHHGIDVAMPCGTTLRAGLPGTVLSPSAPGTPGPAYGVNPVRLRVTGPGGAHDLLIGHTRRVFVHPGQHVRRGQRIALASDSGAPDGCHLHFEVRPPGGGYTTAVDPARWLKLKRA